jgi:hypothetical protein
MRSAVAVLVLASLAGAANADQPAADYHARVELVTKSGAPHAIVTTKLACSAPAKCPEWTLDLGAAEAVELLALVDLLGAPTRVRGVADVQALPVSAKLPAAFVRTSQLDAADTRWERWAVITLEAGKPKLIWRGEIAMTTAKGGGFATSDGVELVATAPGQPLALAFAQVSVPEPNSKPHPAGPSIRRKFVLKDGTYQRE